MLQIHEHQQMQDMLRARCNSSSCIENVFACVSIFELCLCTPCMLSLLSTLVKSNAIQCNSSVVNYYVSKDMFGFDWYCQLLI